MQAQMQSGAADVPRAQARPRLTRGARIGAALLLFAASSALALRQEPRPDPFERAGLASASWWRYPREEFASRRVALVTADLRAVAVQPGSGRIWIAGSGGFLASSDDDGRRWRLATVRDAPPPPDSATPPAPEQAPAPAVKRPAENAPPVRRPAARKLEENPPAAPAAKDPAAEPPYLQQQQQQQQQQQRPPSDSGYAPGKKPRDDASHAALRRAPAAPATRGGARALGAAQSSGRTVAARGVPDETVRLVPVAGGGRPALNAIAFADSALGWAVGDDGTVLVHDSAGAWTRMRLERAGRSAGRLLRARVAAGELRIGAEGGVAYATADGGATWRVEREAAPPRDVAVVEGRSWAVDSGGTVLRSDDGGATWRRARIAGAGALRGVRFRDGRRGWIVGNGGVVLATDDGGITWRWRASGDREPLLGVHLLDGGRGFAVRGGSDGAILSTRDGGRRWREDTATGVAMHAITFADARHGWAVGARGAVVATTDGGRSWTRQDAGTAADLHAVRFADARRGWAAGDSGVVLATRDGGARWELVLPRPADAAQANMVAQANIGARPAAPAPAALRALAVADSSRVLAAGDGGWVLLSPDGGATWRTLVAGSPGAPALLAAHLDARGAMLVAGAAGTARVARLAGDSLAGPPRRPAMPDLAGDLHAIAFASPDAGLMAGDSGTLLVTADGGATWRAAPRDDARVVPADLLAVHLAPDGGAVAVGAGGVTLGADEAGVWSSRRAPARFLPPWYFLSCLAALALAAPAILPRRDRLTIERAVEHRFLSDRPLDEGDRDYLDFRGLALGLSRYIRNENTAPPLTIAITGTWGTGKSSLMNLVRADLRRFRFRPVWFNAWHHQKEEHLLAALLENIRQQAVPRALSREGLIFRARLLLRRTRRQWPLALAAAALAAAAVGFFAADHPARLDRVVQWMERADLKDWRTLVPGTGRQLGTTVALLTAVLTPLLALWRFVRAFGLNPATLMASVSGKMRLSDLKAQAGFRHRFAAEFSEVTWALKPRELVVFIDDLDRCRPDNLLEVLEAVNFLTTSGDCFVVIGVDRERVERWVGLAFKEVAAEEIELEDAGEDAGAARRKRRQFGHDYLEKLINIDVPVPTPTPKQLGSLLAQGGAEEEDADGDGVPDDEERERARPLRARVAAGAAAVGRLTRRALPAAAALALVAASFLATNRLLRPAAEPAAAGAAPALVYRAGPAPVADGAPAAAAPVPDRQGDAAPAAPRPRLLDPEEHAPSARWPLLLGALLLVAGVWSFVALPDAVVRDSPAFARALEAWHPLVVLGESPRRVKRFHNRVRYFAMRQLPAAADPTRWQRLRARLGAVAGGALARLADAFGTLGAPERSAAADPRPSGAIAAAAGRIPEGVLVALSAIAQRHPDWLDDRAFLESPATFLRERIPELPERCLDGDEWAAIDAHVQRFRALAQGVRVDGEEPPAPPPVRRIK